MEVHTSKHMFLHPSGIEAIDIGTFQSVSRGPIIDVQIVGPSSVAHFEISPATANRVAALLLEAVKIAGKSK